MRDRPLIAIVGPLGPAQLACLRSWRQAGLATAFFHVGNRRLPRVLAELADLYVFLPGARLDAGNLGALSERCASSGVQALTTLAEHTAMNLWACKRAGGLVTTHLLLNPPNLYEELESKLKQVAIAEAAGLPVLPTFPLRVAEDALQLPVGQAMVLRPDITRLVKPSFKAEYVETQGQARSFLQNRSLIDAPIVAQPVICGPNLIVHGARASDFSWDHHEAYETEIKFNGLAVSLRPVPLPEALKAACRRFERSIGIYGVFHYDFLKDEKSGEFYFLEANPRLGGTTAKVFASGYDEPLLLVSAHLPEVPTRAIFQNIRRKRSVSRIAAAKCGMESIRHPLTTIDYPSSSRVRLVAAIAAGMAAYRDEVFSLNDWRGNFAYLAQAGT